MTTLASTVVVVGYLTVAAVAGGSLVKFFRKYRLLDDTDPARFQRARLLVVTCALCWPMTLVLLAIGSTDHGRRFIFRGLGDEDDA